MRLHADIYDANNLRLGEGPVTTLMSASVQRRLDGAGSISFDIPAHDQRAAKLLAQERRVRLYLYHLGQRRELGRGIIRQMNYQAGSGGWSISVSGPDTLDELKRVSVLLRREYNNQTVADVASALAALVPGWSASSSINTLISTRMDAVSVLKALQDVAGLQGLHLRQTPGSNIVEVGTFGTAVGLRLINPRQITAGMYTNNTIAFIDSIRQGVNSETLCNRLYVLGAGTNVDSALTLEKCTRTTPYSVGFTTAAGRKLYYIEDSASIALYGVIERFAQFKEIAPLSNNDTDIERAANALYDAAAAWLVRYKDPQESYSVTIKKCAVTIRPGDKIRLVYKEPVLRADGSFTPPHNINADFWVMSVTENVSPGGVSVSLEISNIDRYEESVAKKILGSLDQVRVQGMMVQPTINHYQAGPEQVQIDSSNSAKVQLIFTDATFSVDRVLMRVRTQPFTSTAKSASSVTSQSGGGSTATSNANGSHRHLMMRGSQISAGGLDEAVYQVSADSGGGTFFQIGGIRVTGGSIYTPGPNIYTESAADNHSHDVNIPAHSHDIPPAPLVYGIYKDNTRPGNISITVNGVSVTPSPIGSTGSDLNTTIDITEQIVNKSGGFRTVHDIVVSCAAGQGEVLFVCDIYETITPFKFGA